MNKITQLVDSVSASPDIILRLGAGTGSDYEAYKTMNSGSVIFVEPDKQLAETVIQSFKNMEHVKVIPCAIAAESGMQTLNVTNNRRFSSLLMPEGLLKFYPNVVIDQTSTVEAITLSSLCKHERINQDSDNLLVAELNGMENQVFSRLETETLQKFKWMVIRTSEVGLYSQNSDDTWVNISDTLTNAGFQVLVFKEDSPPFINLLCLRNDALLENHHLRAHEVNLRDTIRVLEHNLSKQLASLDELRGQSEKELAGLTLSLESKSVELDTAHNQVQSLTNELETTHKQSQALTGELETAHNQTQALTGELETSHKQTQALTGELEASHKQIQALTGELETSHKQTQALTGELETSHKQTQALTGELETAHKQTQALTNELDEANARLQSITDEKEYLQLQLEGNAETLDQKSKEISEMNQALRINNKLVLKTDTDLRDLQQQYQAALKHQEQQHTLLTELTGKLRQAAKYYQKLNLQNVVFDVDVLEQEDADDPETDDHHDR